MGPNRPLLLCALLALACQSSPSVKTERIEGASFSDYRSFALAPELSVGDDPAFGPVARQEAEKAIVGALLPRGLSYVDRESADLWLAIGVSSQPRIVEGGHIAVPMRPGVVTQRSGLATPVGNVPLTESRSVAPPVVVARPTPVQAPLCIVVVDAFDADSQRHLWRGASRCRRNRPHRIGLGEIRERVAAIARELPRE